MKKIVIDLVLLVCVCHIASGEPAKSEQGDFIKVYEVNKKVSDFPEKEDLSTPEAAYATIMRDYMAKGASGVEWSKISTMKLKSTERRTVSPEMVQNYLNARIVEVRIFKERTARVFAEMQANGTTGYDQRSLFFHNGRWLNSGHDGLAPTLEAARKTFTRKCERIYKTNLERMGESDTARWNRPPIDNPEAHLQPYVDFLKKEGRQPHTFMMKAFKEHELVTMGEVHNRPRYWAFNAELVRDPAFAELVGTIYLELPLNHQENIDHFLSKAVCEKEIVINMLRDFMEWGWPCQPTLDFFIAVWETNQNLPEEKKIRIRLVDMQRPWEKILDRKDWGQYNVDRDFFMAQNILKDRRSSRGKQRHGFFITGMGHAMEEFYYIDHTTPHESAGWHLKQVLGDQLFTIFQHVPVMTNRGAVSGRLALGLIDTAFAQLEDRPVAFTLQNGPFGTLAFDGMPDGNIYGDFRDGYDAYLYLVPLESEIFSPLIEGFYSKEYTAEIDRRNRLMNGKHLDENLITPGGITTLRSSFWGQPRQWIRRLGPENAWHHGDQWKIKRQQEHLANVRREELTTELDKIYRGIREIDPTEQSWESWENKFGFNYLTMTRWDVMYKWWCDVTKEHPLESVEYGQLSRNNKGLPQIEVTTTLKGGITFSKEFLFEYDALQDSWQAQYGLDLHLDNKWKDFPETGEIPLS
ncbi:MAG: hypothetical protein JXA81_02325 [Sedimentisphaerales bacterium]|nr:hypothetical protein [Sedimentisphaerales bacterium]